MHVDGDLLTFATGCGIRCENPMFAVVRMEQNSRNKELAIKKRWSNFNILQDGFYDPGVHVTCSQKHSVVACMAEKKCIKIFDASKSGMPCKATLQAPNCLKILFTEDKIVTVSYGQIEIHQWNIQDLEEHKPLTLKDAHKNNLSSNKWLDLQDSSYNCDIMEDPSSIDVNVGQSPHLKSHIQGLPIGFDIDTAAKNEASMNHSIFIGSCIDPTIYVVDLEQSKVTNGLMGHHNHGRPIGISTSPEMPNLVMSTKTDNQARIWDLQCHSNLPVLTLYHSYGSGACGEIYSCLAEDMLAFTAGEDQCIRAWDL
jgi:WD40 repeat protein